MDNDYDIKTGKLLIAAENLHDPNFDRTVILLCEHSDKGSFGLVLNHKLKVRLNDVLKELSWNAQLFHGGPVEQNSLHFIHCRDDISVSSKKIIPGVFWGGDFNRMKHLIEEGVVQPEECRFFIGYSGWGKDQLHDEMERKSWYTRTATKDLIFSDDSPNHWRNVFKSMGPEYNILSKFPDDPRLN